MAGHGSSQTESQPKPPDADAHAAAGLAAPGTSPPLSQAAVEGRLP